MISFGFLMNCFIVLIHLNYAEDNIIFANDTENQNFLEGIIILNNENQMYLEILVNVMNKIFSDQFVKDYVFHFDSFTSDIICKILYKSDSVLEEASNKDINDDFDPPVTLMLNYDFKITQIPAVHQGRRSTIHVVSLTHPSRFDELSKEHLKPTDVIIFICHKHYGTCKHAFNRNTDGLDLHFLKDSYFFTAVLVILVIELSENCFRLYEVCYYCGNKASILSLQYETYFNVEMILFDQEIDSHISRLLNKHNWDFQRHVFDIGFFPGGINFACINPKNVSIDEELIITVSCDNSISLEGNMLEEMRKGMNFTYRLLNFEKKFGRVRETLINVVNQSKADWTMGSISVTADRWEKADFTTSIIEDECKVLYNVQDTFFKQGQCHTVFK